MDSALLTTLISTGGPVIVGLAAVAANTYWTSRTISELRQDLRDLSRDLRAEVKDLRNELREFKDVLNGKFAVLDLEIARLLDKKP